MINIWEVKETNAMIEQENLDVRTITLGISLLDCIDSDLKRLKQNIYQKITTTAKDLDCKQADFRYADCIGRRCGVQNDRGFCINRRYAGCGGKSGGSKFNRRIFGAGIEGDDKGG